MSEWRDGRAGVKPWMRARKLPCGWWIMPFEPHPSELTGPNAGRERMALIRPDMSEFVMIWRSHWRPAMRLIMAGKHEQIPRFMYAPVYVAGDG